MSRTYRKNHYREIYDNNIVRYEKNCNGRRPLYRNGDAVLFNEHDVKFWNKLARDGTMNDAHHRNSYRTETNEMIRVNNRKNIKKLIDNPEDYDNMIFYGKEVGKTLFWYIW